MAGVRCVVATCDERRETRVFITEHLSRFDLPAALGYYILNFMDEMRQGWYVPEIRLTGAMIDAGLLEGAGNVRATPLKGAEPGELFDLIVRVEKNERGTAKP